MQQEGKAVDIISAPALLLMLPPSSKKSGNKNYPNFHHFGA
jgi:hypothetical protein